MGSRNRSIRFKIFLLLLLPLLSLSALWGFVLNLTVGDGRALAQANTLYETIGVTSTDLGTQLQAERAHSAMAVTTRKLTEDLGEQRSRTNKSVTTFHRAVTEAGGAIGTELRGSLRAFDAELGRLPSIRAAIDGGLSSRLTTINEYNRVLDALLHLYDHLTTVPDLPIFQQASALQTMGGAREIMARENALISAALVDRTLTDAELAAFSEYVSARTFLHQRARSALDATLRQPYEQVMAGPVYAAYALAEGRVVASGAPPADARDWTDNLAKVSAELDRLGVSSAEILARRSADVAAAVQVRIAIAGGVGLVAVVASIIISVRFGRRLSGELAGLRAAALDLAQARLPSVVERLRAGEEVDVKAEAPPIKINGSSEIVDVARAFGSVQRTAVEAAVGQANLRRGVAQVFLNLARRKQGLLHRQLTLLDGMQRRTHDPDSLEELFRLDHLTTRMRRHAEGLIILSGAAPGRVWRRPVPTLDIVRAAIAEVEDYTRVSAETMPPGAVDGTAAADLTHLLAELVENATIYSPPDTAIQVRGDVVSNGYAIEIEDRGLGLSADEYAAYNKLLVDPPEFDLADSDRLGLFVVARLAERHGIQVMMRASPFGGTLAIVLIPRKLLAEVTKEEPPARPLAVVSAELHAGLPRRVRQASLAPQLKEAPQVGETPRLEEAPAPPAVEERSPEEVRDLFSAFQRGTKRAREEANDEGEA